MTRNLSTLLSPIRTVGDASLILPQAAKAQFESRNKDGAFLDTGNDDFVACWKINIAALMNDGTDIRPDGAWIWGMHKLATGIDDSISCRLNLAVPRIEMHWRVGGTTTSMVVNLTVAGWDGRLCDEYCCALRKTGGVLKFGVVGRTEYQGGYVAQWSEMTPVGGISMDDVGMGADGMVTMGNRVANYSDASKTISAWAIATVAAGKTHADYGTDTDDGLAHFAVDPHAVLSGQTWGQIRSFDFCDSALVRKRPLYQSAVEATDTLVCLHSGHILDYTQGASPTLGSEALPPYSPVCYRPQYRNGTGGAPKAHRRGRVTVAASRHVSVRNGNLLTFLDRLDTATGERISPPVPIADAKFVVDSSDAGALKESHFYHAPNSENHDQASVIIDAEAGCIRLHIGRHGNVYSNEPDTGDTMIHSGSVTSIYPAALPVSHAVPFGAATGNQRGTSYCGGMVAHGGYTYGHSRASDTGGGVWRFWRADSAGVVTSIDLTEIAAASTSRPAAGIPISVEMVSDTHALFVASVRMDAGKGYWGTVGVIVDLTNWGSAVAGWYGARDGTALAAQKGSVSWAEPSIYLAADPAALAQIDAGVLDSTLLPNDVSSAAYCLISTTVSGISYVGLLSWRSTDAQRTAAIAPGLIDWQLKVYTHSAGALTLLRTHDIWPLIQQANGSTHPYYADAPASKFVIPQMIGTGVGLRIANASADGVGFADSVDPANDSWAGSGPIVGGASLSSLQIADWTAETLVTETHSHLLPVDQYDGDSLSAEKHAACYTVQPILEGAGKVQLSPSLWGLPGQTGEGQSVGIVVHGDLPALPVSIIAATPAAVALAETAILADAATKFTATSTSATANKAEVIASVDAIVPGSGAMLTATVIDNGATLSYALSDGPDADDAITGHTVIITGVGGTRKATVADYQATGFEISFTEPGLSIVQGDTVAIYPVDQTTADATLAAAEKVGGGPIEQEPVPASRRAVLSRIKGGLQAEDTINLTVGETALLCSVDFRDDLPRNTRIASITSAAIVSGTAGGITLTPSGTDHNEAKLAVTPLVAGTYIIKVVVAYSNQQGTASGLATLVVTD